MNSEYHAVSDGAPSSQAQHGRLSCCRKLQQMEFPVLIRNLRLVNLVLAIFQSIAGFMGLTSLTTLNVTSFMLSCYAILFAVVLLAFECRFQWLEPALRQNMGFLFTFRGRGLYILFIAFVDFGIAGTMAWFAGVFMVFNGCFNLLVLCIHPEFRSGRVSQSDDPTNMYTMTGEEATAQVLQKNAHLARQAGTYLSSTLAPKHPPQPQGYMPPSSTASV